MRFRNRAEAALLLAGQLAPYRGQAPLVLGLPRGGVPMARIIADSLGADLDVVLVRKLRAPGQPELAIGAVDEAGTVIRGRYFHLGSVDYVREEVRAQLEILRGRRRLYTGTGEGPDPAGRIVVVVDDGVATAASMLAAIRAVRARKPRRLIVAVAVAPPDALAVLEYEADEVVCLQVPDQFYAVGQFFADFSEVTDQMVVTALSRPGVPAVSSTGPRQVGREAPPTANALGMRDRP